ncbi:hypothetical protein N2152v2_001256 [Parachlorella kessleri]
MGPSPVGRLSDDLLASVLSCLDSEELRRTASQVCKRWAALLRTQGALWHRVRLELQPRLSKGRDRRNSYRTPCVLDLDCMGAWLAARGTHIQEAEVLLGYPEALLELQQLLPPLAPALRKLTLKGAASKAWGYVWHTLRFLGDLTRLEDLQLEDCLFDLGELELPQSLTRLHVDSPLAAVPAVVAKLTQLTMLGLADCEPDDDQRDAWLGEGFHPLTALVHLRQVLQCPLSGYETNNPTMPLPVELARSCSALSYLDLTLSCLAHNNWDELHAALPEGCQCMHPHRQLLEGRWQRVAGNDVPGDGPSLNGIGPLERELIASVLGTLV